MKKQLNQYFLQFEKALTMKFTACLFIILMIVGCASKQPLSSDVPTWDERLELEHGDAKAPSLSEKLSNIFSGDSGFHFRKVRWGFSQERVELAEAGNTVYKRDENVLVYKCKLNGVYCELVYTFKDNKLRTAGYLSITPIPNADNLIKEAADKYGVPDIHETYMDGLEEMVWKETETVIFSNLDPSTKKLIQRDRRYSGRGLFKDLSNQPQESGLITYWDGAYAHVDRAFFDALDESEKRFPIDELSFYEKRLTGIVLRGKSTIIPGLGTIPQ